jgi:hypothetical protein
MLPGSDLNRPNPETIHDPFRSSFIFTTKAHKIKSWLYPLIFRFVSHRCNKINQNWGAEINVGTFVVRKCGLES